MFWNRQIYIYSIKYTYFYLDPESSNRSLKIKKRKLIKIKEKGENGIRIK